MALKCGEVIYRRPCRSKPRVFTASDVKRIAMYADQSGEPAVKIVGYVLAGLGLGGFACRGVIFLVKLIAVIEFCKKIAVTLGTSYVVRLIVEYLLRSPLSKLPKWNWYVAILVALLSALEGIFDVIGDLIDDITEVISMKDLLELMCTYVQEAQNVK